MPPNDETIEKDEDKKGREKEAGEKKQEQSAKSVDDLSPTQVKEVLRYVLQQNKTLATELSELKGRVASVSDRKETPSQTDDKGGEDLEVMPRAKFAEFILNTVQEKLVKPHVERISLKERDDESRHIRREIQEFEKSHPDFWTFSDEVKGILNKHPELNIEEAYVLARHSNPDKTKELDAAAVKKQKEEESKKAEERRRGFGGLLPTSGRATRNHAMTAKDAAEQAWQELGMTEHLNAIAVE